MVTFCIAEYLIFQELLGHVHVGLGEEERPSKRVSLQVHVEQCLDEALRFGQVVLVVLAGESPVRSDGRDAHEVVRALPIQVEVGEDRLSAAGHGLLGELVDQYLRELLNPPVVATDQVGCEEQVERVPADGAGEVALQCGGELDHLLDQDLRVPCRFGYGYGVRQVQPELLHVLDGLTAAVRAVDHAQVVQVDVTLHVGVGQVLREHLEQRELLLDPLGEREVGRLRAVGNVGVLLVRVHDYLTRVVKRDAEAGVLPADLRQPVLNQFGVRKFAYQRCGDDVELELRYHLLHLAGHDGGGILADGGLPHQCIEDAGLVPLLDLLIGGAHE
jgi:hypothetical protein